MTEAVIHRGPGEGRGRKSGQTSGPGFRDGKVFRRIPFRVLGIPQAETVPNGTEEKSAKKGLMQQGFAHSGTPSFDKNARKAWIIHPV